MDGGEARFRPIIRRNKKLRDKKNTDFYSGRLYRSDPLWLVPQLGQILHVADDIEYLNRIDIPRGRGRVCDNVELKIWSFFGAPEPDLKDRSAAW